MIHESQPSTFKKASWGKEARKMGKALRLSHVRTKLLGKRDKEGYHETADFRQGGDRESLCPCLTDLANRVEIMKGKEGAHKSEVPPQPQATPKQRPLEEFPSKQQGARRGERYQEMASSSGNKPSTEERLKAMDTTLENLKQLLQFQLDFLENLDSEAGRRLEKLEENISTIKIGFTEELGKLHKELKNPKQELEEKIDHLEVKMSQLNNEWKQDPKN